MRKKVFYFLFLVLAIISLIACSPKKVENTKMENIDFQIEKTHLSQSFQFKDPYAKFVSKGEDVQTGEQLKLLVSLGAMESSGLQVKEITRVGKKLSIYVDSLYDENSLELAVPQALLYLNAEDFQSIENYNFEIINDNGHPLDIKLDMKDAINKVESQFKIASNISPDIHLLKDNDNLFWEIYYLASFDKDKPEIPLVEFYAKINANDGAIIDSKKSLIANPIDSGHIMNIKSDKYILYKKVSKDSEKEELWIYNIIKDTNQKLFTSDYTINSTQFSPSLSYISIIESDDSNYNLYIINYKDNKAYKVVLDNEFKPNLACWKDNHNILLVQNFEDKSRICNYNVIKSEQEDCIRLDIVVDKISGNNGKYILTESKDKSLNNNIYITEDFKDLNLVTKGYKPEFLGKDNFIYFEDEKNKDLQNLKLYNLKTDEKINILSGHISDFQVISKNEIVFLSKEENHNNFNLNYLSLSNLEKIKIKEIEPERIINTISDKLFYNKLSNLIFLNVQLPFESETKELIYIIDTNYK